MKHLAAIFGAGLLGIAACAPVPVEPVNFPTGPYGAPVPAPAPVLTNDGSPQSTAQMFVAVMRRMEPAVERDCLQRRTQPINCDFQFVVDDRPGQEANAFQTIDASGRPIIGFTLSLIAQARNGDEIAFVVGHEASHHILNHLDRKAGAAAAGAIAGCASKRRMRGPSASRSAQRTRMLHVSRRRLLTSVCSRT